MGKEDFTNQKNTVLSSSVSEMDSNNSDCDTLTRKGNLSEQCNVPETSENPESVKLELGETKTDCSSLL